MDWKKGMFRWDLEMERRKSSSPELSRNWMDWETEIRPERELYAELEFRTLASLVQHDQESPRQETNIGKLIHRRTKKNAGISSRCCLNVGNVLLIVLLLTASILLLLLYLQVSCQRDDIKREAEELRINHSLCQEELEDQQKMNMILQSNTTFLIQDKSRQETMLSQLQENHKQYVQNTQRMQQSYQQFYKNYSILQEMYSHLRSSYVFLHRESAILLNCHRRNSSNDGTGVICPFCRSDWHFFGTSCYLLSPSATSWQECAQWCRTQGAHLTVVNDLEEQYFLQGLVKETSWIGLSDRDIEGEWQWVDGTPYVKSAKSSNLWTQNQPDNLGNEDCAVVSPGSGWNDEKCIKSYLGICEHRAFQLLVRRDMISN
ncbi:uncharacterized protein ACMZJ9_013719 [Mantella aurantiaca]